MVSNITAQTWVDDELPGLVAQAKAMVMNESSQGGVLPASAAYESIIPNPKLKLLDKVREVMGRKRYSIRTERTYCEWPVGLRPGWSI
jgi:hypothetical protein